MQLALAERRGRLSEALGASANGRRLKRGYRAVANGLLWLRTSVADRPFVLAARLSPAQRRAFQTLTARLQLPGSAETILLGLRWRLSRHGQQRLWACLDVLASPSPALPVCHHGRDFPPAASAPRRRILIVAGEFPNPHHGGGARLADFIRLLAERHEVYLYSVYLERQDRAALEAIRPCLQDIVTQPYEVFEAHTSALEAFPAAAPFDIIHYEWPRALRHAHTDRPGLHLYTCLEPVSLRHRRDMDRLTPGSHRWWAHVLAMVDSLPEETLSLRGLDACLTVTAADADYLAAGWPAVPYYVVNHGVTLDAFVLPDRPPEPDTLMFIGNYQHYPNQDAAMLLLDRIMPIVWRARPAATLLLVGANPTRALLRRHDGQRVVVTGPVDDFRPYVQRATVCLASLVTGAGLRTKVVQYAALRRPAVVTSIAAADLLFRDGEHVLIRDDPAEFAAAIVALLAEPDRARAMGAAACAVVETTYDNRRIVAQLETLYATLLAGQRPLDRGPHQG